MLTSISYRAKARKKTRRQAASGSPPPLAWSVLCCTVWHGSTTGAHPCTLIYIIIIGGCPALHSVRRVGGIWYRWRCYT
nr:MAG TPA: hypothetical protein [Caudoviricetes sp.]